MRYSSLRALHSPTEIFVSSQKSTKRTIVDLLLPVVVRVTVASPVTGDDVRYEENMPEPQLENHDKVPKLVENERTHELVRLFRKS